MTAATKGEREPRQVRLALVMNGGVSLAVWMGGVTHELDRVRRAAYPAAPGAQSDETLSMWQHLLAAVGCRVLVDVIAGTSAGGLNGTLLATSIARGVPLTDVKTTWMKVANFRDSLLITDRDDTRRSVLDGTYFRNELAKVFHGVKEHAAEPGDDLADHANTRDRLAAALAREATLPRAVTLIVTGTNLAGVARTYSTADGHAFDQRDYRTRFTFQRDILGERMEFQGEDASARLARAARCTASFPAAFEPTFIRSGTASSEIGSDPEQPTDEGPDMQPASGLSSSAWMIDGGVMDNEPFGPVLDAVASRPVDGDVERVVAYIVPSDDVAEALTAANAENPPGPVTALMAADSLPREANILSGLQRMQEMLLTADPSRSVLTQLVDLETGSGITASEAMFETYRSRRATAAIWEARLLAARSQESRGGLLSPLPAPSDVPAGAETPWLPAALPAPDEDPAAEWGWGISTASRLLRTVLDLLRGRARAGEELSDELLTVSAAQHDLESISDAFEHGLVEALSSAEGPFALRDDDVMSELEAAFRSSIAGAPRQIGQLVRDAVGGLLKGSTGKESPPDAVASWVRTFLHAEVIARIGAPPVYVPRPTFRFYRFSLSVPSPFLGDGTDVLTSKLTGSSAHHFGAFFRESWRAYDWMWGRLDGAAHLVRLLVTEEAVKLADARGQAQLLATCADAADQDAVASAVATVAHEDDPDRCSQALRSLHAALAKPLHRAILRAELPGLAVKQRGEDASTSSDSPRALDYGDAPDAVLHTALAEISAALRAEAAHPLALPDGESVAIETAASGLRAAAQDRSIPPAAQGLLKRAAGVAFAASEDGLKGDVIRKTPAVASALARGFSRAAAAAGHIKHGAGRVVGFIRRPGHGDG